MPDNTNDDEDFANEDIWQQVGTMQRSQPATGGFDTARFAVDWLDRQRQPTLPADPAYPNGTGLDVALTALSACRLELPYPAARCGMWLVRCRTCGFAIALATAGRVDDPRTLRVPCKLH